MMEGSAGDLSSLALSAAHAAKTGGDEQTAGEVLIVGDAELQTAGVEQRVERAVDDALGADVHPAAGGHLTVVGNAERGSAVEVLPSSKVPTIRPLEMMTRGAILWEWKRPRG